MIRIERTTYALRKRSSEGTDHSGSFDLEGESFQKHLDNEENFHLLYFRILRELEFRFRRMLEKSIHSCSKSVADSTLQESSK